MILFEFDIWTVNATTQSQGRRNRPPNPTVGGGPGLVRGPALNTGAFFFLEKIFYLEKILMRVTMQH